MSLKARALQWLARRDQSRMELRRKLLPHARAAHAGSDAADPGAAAAQDAEAGARVDELLDWLAAQGLLSDTRFVESRVTARAPRFGNRRIQQELARHGLVLDTATREALQASEVTRAGSVLRRRFSQPPVDASERARQWRFLAGRGFSHDVIRQVISAGSDE